MRAKRKAVMFLAVAILATAALVVRSIYSEESPVVPEPGVAIPFEWIANHIIVQVQVNNSRPLSFVFDTGNKYSVIELERAKELGIQFAGEVQMQGTGEKTSTGYFVKDANFTLPAFEGFSQPLSLALPVGHLAASFGHDFDGLLGTEFMKLFVIEIDYPNHQLILHDREMFRYAGKGEIIPLEMNSGGHPTIEMELTLPSQEVVSGTFLIDIGSGGAVNLNSPFVAAKHLLDGNLATVRAIGKVGAGGESTGRIGHISSVKIGNIKIPDPITYFSQDKGGAHASQNEMGSLGGQVISKFDVILDLDNDRMFLEANATFADWFACTFYGGLSILAEGKDFHVFRVNDVLENSPASEVDMRKDDIIEAVNEMQASELTLTKLFELLKKPVQYKVRIRRGEATMEVTLTPRPLV